jgi:hypothetical protein
MLWVVSLGLMGLGQVYTDPRKKKRKQKKDNKNKNNIKFI